MLISIRKKKNLKVNRKGKDEEVAENTILEDDVIQFDKEEDLRKLEELFEDIKKSPTEAPHLLV